MCASSMVTYPRSIRVNVNRIISEIPVTMSGMVMGRLVMVIMTACGRLRMAWMPMAASVPSTVAAMAAITAMDSVTYSDFMMAWSPNSSTYQRRENPSHLARLLPALKLCTISTAMGV